jgi:hypothetical protein
MKVTPSVPTAALWLVVAAGCGPPSPRRDPSPVSRAIIDTLALGAHARFLADDSLKGRRAGSEGARRAAEYLAASCRTLGLEPLQQGDYFQHVLLTQVVIRSSRLDVVTGAGRSAFQAPQDYVLDLDLGSSLSGFSGPARWIPTPVAPGDLPEVRGAIAIAEALQDRDMLDTLAARGAVALALAVRDARRYDLYARSRGDTRLMLAAPGTRSSLLRTLPTIALGPAAAAAVRAGTVAPRDGEPGVWMDLRTEVEESTIPDRNVACLLPGRDDRRRDSAIVLAAHYDHLGLGIPDQQGDSLYNGFSDNAAGVAMVLSIAAAFRDPRHAPEHSIVFLFLAAEEQGLLGSDYYAAHPLWPLERTVGMINLDAGAPPGRPASWRLAGVPGSPLALLATDVAHSRGWSATVTQATPNSDHFPFLRAGVPAVFIIPGPGPYEGLSVDSSRALRARWDHYHQPADEWAPDFPLAGLGRYAEYAFLVARALDLGATNPDAPFWRRGPRGRR